MKSLLQVTTRDLAVTSPKSIQKAILNGNFKGRHSDFFQFPQVVIEKSHLLIKKAAKVKMISLMLYLFSHYFLAVFNALNHLNSF